MNPTGGASKQSASYLRFLEPLLGWRERRFARSCCQELLRTYNTIATEHPDLAREELYRQVVALRTGGSAEAVRAVLKGADESYAWWPQVRDLTLRDIAHYLSVTEFLATHGESPWIHNSLKRVVSESIPSRF